VRAVSILFCRCGGLGRGADFRVPAEDLMEDISYSQASPDDLPAVKALLELM
jgi:hypothetical protein